MERNLSHVLKCPDEAPTSEEILYNMDPSTCFMYSVLTLMTLVGSLVYLEETVYITRKITPSCKKTAYIWVTGAPPVIAATSYVGLWVPRSSMFTDFTASIYLSICLHKFLVMMLEEFGGEETLVRRLQGKPLKTSTGPCCCCCLCLPPLHVSRTSLTILKWGTLQAALLRPTLMFFATVLWSNGTYQQGKMEVKEAFLWITLLSVAAFLLSLWPIGIVFAQAQLELSKRNIVPKFALNQCVVVLSQAQSGIMDVLISTGTISCVPPFSARARGTFMHQQLLVVEMFIVIFATRFYYRWDYSGSDAGNPGPC
ncbi:organic solute transporter subunit alpha-like isoform X2 [Brienomyrus brachyistius]|uniref:organic solute transporter subunit alpha-like isoform X2 n=1 Tax=Brienomyrus brachyistius TaxID=42636 RepID=UPI0020B3369C|nr:organic solute transporter subunit alpha-like isoform X2 [Brienomyrus brachyistius]